MSAIGSLPDNFKINEGDLAATPPAVLELLQFLIAENAALRKRVEELEAELGQNSSNSNKPRLPTLPMMKKEKLRTRKRRGKDRRNRPKNVKALGRNSCRPRKYRM